MTDPIEVIAQIKFESDMGLHSQWTEGLWDQVPLTERLALTNNMQSFIAALNAAGLVVVPKEPTGDMGSAGLQAIRFDTDWRITTENVYKAMIEEAGT